MFLKMGNCCHCHLKSRISSVRPKKIVLLLVGLDNAGKTTTAQGLIGEIGDVPVPTVGFSCVSLMYGKYSVFIYDLGGGPQIRGIWDKYFVDVHGIIFVVDASDADRFDESRDTLHSLVSHPKLSRKPLLVLANKQDREGALDELDICEKLDLERLVNEQRTPTIVETCSATVVKNAKQTLDKGIHDGYRWLVNYIIRDYPVLNARVMADMAEQKMARDKQRQQRLAAFLKNQKAEGSDQAEEEEEEILADPFRPISDVVKTSEKTTVKNGSISVPSLLEKREGNLTNGVPANASEIVPEGSSVPVGVTELVKEQLELEKSHVKRANFFSRKNKTNPSPVTLSSPSASPERRAKTGDDPRSGIQDSEQLELEKSHVKRARFFSRKNKTSPSPDTLSSPSTSPERRARTTGNEPRSGGQDSGIGSPPKLLPPLKESEGVECSGRLPGNSVPLPATAGKSQGSQAVNTVQKDNSFPERAWDLHKAFEVVPAYNEEKDGDSSVT